MKMTLIILLAAAGATCAYAQALARELEPLAAKYKADVAALEDRRSAAIAKAQASYANDLGAAERTATTAGNVAALAAITTERGAMSSGLMAPVFPSGLPKELRTPRKTYLDAVARIRATEAPRRQAIDAAYLRSLSSLVSKASKNPALAKQLEAEKHQLLAAASGNGSGSKKNAKSAVVNGTFDLMDSEARPSGWMTPEGIKVVRDGVNRVLHASSPAPGYLAVTQDILVPPKAKSVTLTGRVRGKMTSRDPNQGHFGANIAAVYLDSNGSSTSNWLMLDGGNDEDWKTLSTTQKVPDNMKTLQLQLVLKYVAGEFDYDDIEVEFE